MTSNKLFAFGTALVIGTLSALAQAFLGVAPPIAYGICMVGHPKDLVTKIANHVLGTKFMMQQVSVDIPVLTAIGVLTGSAIATLQYNEFRPTKVRDPLAIFIKGFLVANFALTLGACPLREIVYMAYGNLHAVVGFLFIMVGVIAGAEYLKRRGAVS